MTMEMGVGEMAQSGLLEKLSRALRLELLAGPLELMKWNRYFTQPMGLFTGDDTLTWSVVLSSTTSLISIQISAATGITQAKNPNFILSAYIASNGFFSVQC